jgi:integrase
MKTNLTSDRINVRELNRFIENLSYSEKENDKRIKLIIQLQYYTCLRFGDTKNIRFDDVLNYNQYKLTESKTQKIKTITINPQLKSIVKKYFEENITISNSDFINNYSIQYINKKLKEYKFRYNITNYANDRKFNFSTHSIRKSSLFEVYRKVGINVSLKISNHQSIFVHLKYICAEDDIKDAYMCL